jgi:hypothetical protein
LEIILGGFPPRFKGLRGFPFLAFHRTFFWDSLLPHIRRIAYDGIHVLGLREKSDTGKERHKEIKQL